MTMTVKASQWQEADSVGVDTVEQEPPRKLSLIRRIIRGFDRTDDRYIEPQHYVFTVMMQATHTYDYYTPEKNRLGFEHIQFTDRRGLTLP